ncbi:MAG TPA: ABC transporter ATP-binding protein, partial [Acetivibrio sp.]|nr:ABC transporter ATP-binding protein [Acetivibrio sp.]
MSNPKKHLHLKPKNPKKTLIRLFSYFRYNKIMFFGGIFFIMLGAAAQVAADGMLSPIIDSFVKGSDRSVFIRYVLIMAAIVVVIAVSQYFGNMFMAKLAQKTVHKIRKELFAHMEKLPVSYFDKHSHGDLMSTFTNDVDMLNQTLEQSVSQIIISVVSVVGSFGMMLYLSPLLTVMVVVMLVVMFASIRYIGQKSAKNFRAQQAALADINGYIEEMMTGQKVVKVFNYEKRAIKTFKEKNEELRKASTDASAYGVMLMPIMGNLSYVMYALVSMFGAFLVMKGRMTVGNIASFLQYTRSISRPITMVSNQMNMLFA